MVSEREKRLVFISHASANFSLADEIRTLLEARGIPCWIAPRDILGSKAYFEEIVHGIKECAVTLLLLTDEANNSEAVAREIERAFAYQKPILPLRLKRIKPSAKLEFIVASCQWVDVFDTPLKRRIEQVVNIVKAIETGTPPPTPAPEKKTLLGRLERSLEQTLRHKLLAALAALILLAAIGVAAWSSIQTVATQNAQMQALVDMDPLALGLVRLNSIVPGDSPGTDKSRATAAVYLNAKGTSFADIGLHASISTANSSEKTIDLSPLVKSGGFSGAQVISFDVPKEVSGIKFCMTAIHPSFRKIYTARWSFSTKYSGAGILITPDVEPKLMAGEVTQCS